MRSISADWVFPIYSGYDDSAYGDHMVTIDQLRIQVCLMSTTNQIQFPLDRMGIIITVKIFVRNMVAFSKDMIKYMQ